MHRTKSFLSALTVGILLIGALSWAAGAATGNYLVIGAWNRAGHTTTLKNSDRGPALTLKAKHGPALAVNNSKRVKFLNADEVDGMSAKEFLTNTNSVYQWTVASHTGGFTIALPPVAPGGYLVSWSAQFNGAGGDPGNPNIISCHVTQSGVSGVVTFQKAIIGDQQLTSEGTPPSLSGTGPTIVQPGDVLSFDCTMSRNAQIWSTSQYQPLTVNLLHVDSSTVSVGTLAKPATMRTRTYR